MDLGVLIKKARQEAGLTQAALQAKMGLSSPENSPMLSRWENGKSGISTASFTKLADLIPIQGAWESPGVWVDPDGTRHNLNPRTKGVPRPPKVTPEERQDILQRYAKECERIYENRTAGDFTWQGVLVSFLNEVL